ncbi:MAG: response regulator [Anaerocolumna sp.]|nr:response regulator [Anaerocolumna sp.]
MITIAICDDDNSITKKLKEIIEEYCNMKSVEITFKIFHNGETLLISDALYDIIFLDIYMDGLNGIETAKHIRQKDQSVEIIFLTSFSGLTREALSVHAFEYLEKPIQKEVIFHQMDEVISKLSYKKGIEENKAQIVSFYGGRNDIGICVSDIYYFERTDRKIKAVTKKGNFILYETIASLEEKLQEFNFVTPHQSFVVNINNIKDYIKDQIIMTNYDIIPVAQKRSSELKRCMREFLQNKLENR